MTIWVSGATGKLGSAVMAMLRSRGTDVKGVDQQAESAAARVDLRDFDATKASMTGADSVVHLAARPSPEGVEPSWLVENNVMSTFNVFQAAAELQISRIIMASSGSIYGGAWSPTLLTPPYLPIDERTALEYVDPYALTKDLGERIAGMFARRGMTVIALRFHWIVTPRELDDVWDVDDGEDGARNLWGYVRLDDAARACVLAVGADLPPGSVHPVVIAASNTRRSTPTSVLLQQWFPGVERRREFTGTDGLFDTSRAERLLGWRPTSAG